MARRAIRDTYGIERVGNVEIRRIVKAGQDVPAHYEVDEDALEEFDRGSTLPGYKPEQRTVRVRVDHNQTQVEHEAERTERRETSADRPGSKEDVELSAAEQAKSAPRRRQSSSRSSEDEKDDKKDDGS
jgi:hypothetical protein